MKTLSKTALISAAIILVLLAAGQVALGQAKCTVNGQEIPCESLTQQFKNEYGGSGTFILVPILVFIIGIAGSIFWLFMMAHAISNEIEDKIMWIAIMIILGVFGALVYYFQVKRNFDRQPPPEQMEPPPAMRY